MKWEIPGDLKYTRKHEWVKQENGIVTIGITDYAQDMLKDIVYVELPNAGRAVKAGEGIVILESVKAVNDVYSPVDGVIVEVNENLLDQPELLNQSPYCEGWIVKFEAQPGYENEELMDKGEYEAFVLQEAGE